VFNEIERRAAQGSLLHNDDSTVRMLAFMGKRRAALVAQGKLEHPERTGLFTTAIVSSTEAGHLVVFYSGRKHAGENMDDVLDSRKSDLPTPMQMGDALSRNVPKRHRVIEGNCLSHARRNIVDEIDNYPKECRFIIETLAEVYQHDAAYKALKCSDALRLLAHQRESGPLMERLKTYMTTLLENKRIEPNSGLGQAFTYFLKRWDKLTLFLRLPGAPLDNNITERMLKMAIRLRKTSMFYRSERGAFVGDMYMTLICNAELHQVNPFDYLKELFKHIGPVAQNPADWLPWTYKETLARRAMLKAA
jgi:hypothetical protein